MRLSFVVIEKMCNLFFYHSWFWDWLRTVTYLTSIHHFLLILIANSAWWIWNRFNYMWTIPSSVFNKKKIKKKSLLEILDIRSFIKLRSCEYHKIPWWVQSYNGNYMTSNKIRIHGVLSILWNQIQYYKRALIQETFLFWENIVDLLEKNIVAELWNCCIRRLLTEILR